MVFLCGYSQQMRQDRKRHILKGNGCAMEQQKGSNTFVVGITGNFDDAQSGVKAMFGNKELAGGTAGKSSE